MIEDKDDMKVNPYDYMRPVIDPTSFAGRNDELKIIKEEIDKLKGLQGIPPIIALSGERRVGKTSILYRLEEFCKEANIITIKISLTDSIVSNPWDFWQVIFDSLQTLLSRLSIDLPVEGLTPIGFKKPDQDISHDSTLRFQSYYANQRLIGAPLLPSIILSDLQLISEQITRKGYVGLLFLLDEAHMLVDLNEIQQQLRDSITQARRIGIVFAGEPSIGRMFNDSSNRFFHQGKVVQIRNFQNLDDVAECAVKPLTRKERLLMSPMTIDYIARLSQGKPNQIRLICNTIYSSYMNNNQKNLNININTLHDVLEVISSTYTEYDLSKLVDKIQNLSAVDLEILYRITRYPNWDIDQIIDLDESFRGEIQSNPAEERRKRILSEIRGRFIEEGLLRDIENRCVLSGDEFTYLYVRFLYEIRKYGDLSRRLELGKGPPTPFSEKVDKLVRSLSFELGRHPRIRRFTHYGFNVETNEIKDQVRQKFRVLENLIKGQTLSEQGLNSDKILHLLGQCSEICELVKETGPHHFVSLLVRNAQDINELIHVELYFDPVQIITLVSSSIKKLLKQQSDQAKVWIEDIDDFKIANLPNLRDLLQIVCAPTLEEILENANDVITWRIESVQHIVTKPEDSETSPEITDKASDDIEDDEEAWLKRYDSADENGAIAILNDKISKCTEITDNPKLARYYNDRGYIKSIAKMHLLDEAKKDLEKAIAYHHQHLELTLLNLSVIYIDEEDYPIAIHNIEDALFLATARENIIAGYLKLRLPTNSLVPIGKMEQHPANVIEASYINLAYALFKTNQRDQALEAIEEGLTLFPNAYRLKHAKARIYLCGNQAPLANEIYDELSKMNITDQVLSKEVKDYVQRFVSRRRRKRSHIR